MSKSKFWQDAGNNAYLGPWLGDYRSDNLAEPAGYWGWVTSEAWSSTNWRPGEPNDGRPGGGGNEQYLHFLQDSGGPLGTWNDAPGSLGFYGYVVEWDGNPVPIPSAVWLVGSSLLGLVGQKRKFGKG